MLDTTEHKIVLASADGAVFVLMGTTDPHKGKVVGQVATPQPVIDTPAIPTHTPIPTNTITPTPTRTPTPTPRVDAEIVGIASSPNGQAMQGERVEIAVTVRNNGSRAMNIPVRLTFPSVDKKPERKSPRVQPGQTGVATFTWKTSDYEPGDYALTADLLLDGNTTYGDTAATVGLRLTPLVIAATIADVTVSQASAVVGEAVTIAVAVRNDGRVAANIPVTLHFPSDDKQAETRKPWADPGETVVVTFTWRTSRYEPGSHAFRVAVPGAERRFTAALVAPTPRVDVEIVGIASNPNGHGDAGRTGGDCGYGKEQRQPCYANIPVRLTFPSVDKKPERKSPKVPAGGTGVATFTWRTSNYEPGDYALTADLQVWTAIRHWAIRRQPFRLTPDPAGGCRRHCGA